MTTSKSSPTSVVVVDGSNIATEGRSIPSLVQLNDAVMAFKDEFPDAVITVVVDATFGHRIDRKEAAEFDAAVAHNELVAPPAGAIGRGDAFVLSIANKVGARVLSNDSFQEFHGEYPWLFDEGRLIGGKPVPNVGWVFVERLPVKGPVSRKAQRAARGSTARSSEARAVRRSSSKEASQPMPVPTAPPPAARRAASPPREPASEAALATAKLGSPGSGAAVNELMPFINFVEHHPVGSSVNGVVESYSSHGAYVTVGDLRGYVPLRLMSDPPPRSAREVMKVGDAVTLVVTNFAPARRSVDLAVPHMAPGAEVVPTPELEELEVLAEAIAPARRATRRTAQKVAAADAPKARARRATKQVAAPEPAVLPAPAAMEEEAAAAAAAAAGAPAPKAARQVAAKRAAATKPAKPAKAKAAAKEAPPDEPAAAEKPRAKRSAARRASAGPAVVEPVAGEPTAVEPAVVEPTATEPAAVGPAAVEPVVVEPVVVGPAAVEPVVVEEVADVAPAKKAGAKRAASTKVAAVAPSDDGDRPDASRPARARRPSRKRSAAPAGSS